jgi:hypothetical protein
VREPGDFAVLLRRHRGRAALTQDVLAARNSQPDLAAVLFAAGTATAEASGLVVSFPPSREGADHWLAVVRSSLDQQTWQQAQETGRTLPADVRDVARQIRRPEPS